MYSCPHLYIIKTIYEILTWTATVNTAAKILLPSLTGDSPIENAPVHIPVLLQSH